MTLNLNINSYNTIGDNMKIYLDLIFILNFSFDFILLLSVSIVLKRNIKLKKIFLGSLIGGLSIFLLFFNINSLLLFILKFLISILMLLVSFKYKNIKYTLKNIEYLYINSIILGGFLYFLNTEFSYKHEGLVFYYKGLSINFIFLIIFSPIIIYIYIKQIKNLKTNYNMYYKINIYYDKLYELTAYLDTGNKLVDPLTHKPVIIIKENIIKKITNYRIIPCTTINGNSTIKCIKVKKIEIKDVGTFNNVLVGMSKNLNMEGIDCILNQLLMEGK